MEMGGHISLIAEGENVLNDNAELLSATCVENSLVVPNNLKCHHKHFSWK